jgi:ribokinase
MDTEMVDGPTVVVVLGGINMDLIGAAPRLPAPGETVRGERFYTAPGGKGANQAVAAARLGARVRMVGRVGNDMFGPGLLDGLRGYGIDVSGVAVDPERASGIALILLDSQKQNHIVAIYGANMACDDDQLRAVETALQGADSLLLQHEVPIEVSAAAARAARKRGVRVIWDPAPAGEIPPAAFADLDIITPNQTEAEYLTGVSVADVDSARAAAEVLLERGAAVAVVKLGEMGVYFASDGASGHVASYRVDVVDTIAAGDGFAGALAVALAEGRGLEDAVRYGAAAGALAVTRPGAQEAMPARDEVEALLSAG